MEALQVSWSQDCDLSYLLPSDLWPFSGRGVKINCMGRRLKGRWQPCLKCQHLTHWLQHFRNWGSVGAELKCTLGLIFPCALGFIPGFIFLNIYRFPLANYFESSPQTGNLIDFSLQRQSSLKLSAMRPWEICVSGIRMWALLPSAVQLGQTFT